MVRRALLHDCRRRYYRPHCSCSFGSMVPYAQADSFGALTINAVWGRDTASPKLLAGDTYSIVRVATVTTNNDGSVSSYKTVG